MYDNVTHFTDSKLKGRKRAGGIRLGEMERDALIAHGTSFLLQDRLMNCSDYSTAWVCRTCGSLISLGYDDVAHGEVVVGEAVRGQTGPTGEYCRICKFKGGNNDGRNAKSQMEVTMALPENQIVRRASDMDVVAVPYVFRYLCAELAAMGLAVSLEV